MLCLQVCTLLRFHKSFDRFGIYNYLNHISQLSIQILKKYTRIYAKTKKATIYVDATFLWPFCCAIIVDYHLSVCTCTVETKYEMVENCSGLLELEVRKYSLKLNTSVRAASKHCSCLGDLCHFQRASFPVRCSHLTSNKPKDLPIQLLISLGRRQRDFRQSRAWAISPALGPGLKRRRLRQ